eukprot:13535248-Alexandrium_andersonii.AAC.1
MCKPSRGDGYEFGEHVSIAFDRRTWTAASNRGRGPESGWGAVGARRPTSSRRARARCARRAR